MFPHRTYAQITVCMCGKIRVAEDATVTAVQELPRWGSELVACFSPRALQVGSIKVAMRPRCKVQAAPRGDFPIAPMRGLLTPQIDGNTGKTPQRGRRRAPQ